MSIIYSIGHHRFVSTLYEHGLSETEIGYCCIYAMGLDIKGITTLLNKKNVYNTNASIRKKLGLQDCLTPLPEYLRNLPL